MNFPEIWVARVIQNLTNQSVAPWLDGIPELDADVTVLEAGSASELTVINIPRANFNPDVLVNNSVYPIPVQAYTDDSVVLSLDKYQTKATSVSDDQIIGSAYDKIDATTRSHTRAILTKKFKKAIHSIAPTSDAAATPVIAATGPVVNGVATLTYEDLVALKGRLDADEVDPSGRRIVLSTKHWNDLLIDRKNFGDKLVNYNTGMPAPMIAGFELFQYNGNPLFTSAGVKKAFGAVVAAGDREGSVAFWTGGIAKKTGLTKQYFEPASSDTANQANLLNYRHYFMAIPFESRFIAAIY
ncbi:hypothetical protein ACFX5D_14045 [Flavobacterium sp. LB3P45]|uniref:Uncharacterized protein n=1 Tax=Flavobacterium fructosi TaxID=3230416 RepID=A0ABW6HPW5_9FLAO